jgi:hypothetical protein
MTDGQIYLRVVGDRLLISMCDYVSEYLHHYISSGTTQGGNHDRCGHA